MMHLNLNFKQLKVAYSEDDIIIIIKFRQVWVQVKGKMAFELPAAD